MLSYPPARAVILAACLSLALVPRVVGQAWPCNPTKNASCPPTPGLAQSDYFIDFTNPPADLANYWRTSNYATVTYNTKGKNGAEFTFAKRYDAPQLFTNFYIFFGRVDIVMQVAPGIGIISSGVLLSDDFDEIDWEMSGNNFKSAQYASGAAQNNYFGKGVTGIYDRGGWAACASPQTQFHTYSFEWSPTKLDWILDGKVVRTFLAANGDNNEHQYPQTPSKIQLGVWDGGDPDQDPGTVGWAGGLTNTSAAPFTMFVKSVSIKNYYPAKYYNWTDQSGSWKSIKPFNDSISVSSSSVAPSSASTRPSVVTDKPPSANGGAAATQTSISTASKPSSAPGSPSPSTTQPAASKQSTLVTQTASPGTTAGSPGQPSANKPGLSVIVSVGKPPTITTSVLSNAGGGVTTPTPPSSQTQTQTKAALAPSTPIVISGSGTPRPTAAVKPIWVWPLPVSQHGACGHRSWHICKGSTFGDCCSRQGYCGNTTGACGDDCQTHWGVCSARGGSSGGQQQQKTTATAAAGSSSSTKCPRATGRAARGAGTWWWARDGDLAYPPGRRPNASEIVV